MVIHARTLGRCPLVFMCAILIFILMVFAVCPCTGSQDCPNMCRCAELGDAGLQVNCRRRGLNQVQQQWPVHATSIDLSHNNFETLTNQSLYHTNEVKILRITNSRVQSIESGVFQQQVLLEELYLNENGITSLPNELFSSLSRLRVLDLSSNLIQELSPNLFAQNHYLSQLELSTNLLSSIHVDLFKSQIDLHHLDLSSNRFEVFHPHSFFHCSNLFSLNLTNNPIVCDCPILPLVDWIRSASSINWTSGSILRCSSPQSMMGIAVTEVDLGDTICSPLNKDAAAPVKPAVPIRTIITRSKQKKASQFKSTLGKIPYNPMLGWYTAGALSGMLVLFLVCVALDKAKRTFYKWRRKRRQMRKPQEGSIDGFVVDCSKLTLELHHSQNRLQQQASNRSSLSGGSKSQPQMSIKSNGSDKMPPLFVEIYPQDIVIEVRDHSTLEKEVPPDKELSLAQCETVL